MIRTQRYRLDSSQTQAQADMFLFPCLYIKNEFPVFNHPISTFMSQYSNLITLFLFLCLRLLNQIPSPYCLRPGQNLKNNTLVLFIIYIIIYIYIYIKDMSFVQVMSNQFCQPALLLHSIGQNPGHNP